VIYYLSGLTCTDENFIQKAGAQRKASELGVALIAPDTSPRGLGVPGESDAWDFGVGAGFYLNATVRKAMACPLGREPPYPMPLHAHHRWRSGRTGGCMSTSLRSCRQCSRRPSLTRWEAKAGKEGR
jgi:hypothetical protein